MAPIELQVRVPATPQGSKWNLSEGPPSAPQNVMDGDKSRPYVVGHHQRYEGSELVGARSFGFSARRSAQSCSRTRIPTFYGACILVASFGQPKHFGGGARPVQ